MNKIQRISMIFRIFFQIGFIILPLLQLIGWIFGPEIQLGGEKQGIGLTAFPRDIELTTPLTIHTRLLGFFISMLPTIVQMYLCSLLIKLFRCYENKEIFSLTVVRCFRNIGITLILQMIIEIIYLILIHLALTSAEQLNINFSSVNIDMVLLALFIILNSWIMTEGYKLREEQQLTI